MDPSDYQRQTWMREQGLGQSGCPQMSAGLGVNGTASLTTIMATSLYVVWNSMEYMQLVALSLTTLSWQGPTDTCSGSKSSTYGSEVRSQSD